MPARKLVPVQTSSVLVSTAGPVAKERLSSQMYRKKTGSQSRLS
jgi:hypothetical protein